MKRVTVSVSEGDLNTIGLFIRAGEFGNRSEFIRHAVHDYVAKHIPEAIKTNEIMNDTYKAGKNLNNLDEYQKNKGC